MQPTLGQGVSKQFVSNLLSLGRSHIWHLVIIGRPALQKAVAFKQKAPGRGFFNQLTQIPEFGGIT
jgi:hypothetical protein